ncbi:ABC transporter ATP-binding protein [Luteolibacter sp. LG18]|uniref:ABC transporter ATP-binding protein n=1 Tax=Luteolibacter sp. LG18 TaxID=2819286 RepID=UPI002B2CBEBA|nr:ABC transporter ATP-binding protein [Luteolibacter sp. LG18]
MKDSEFNSAKPWRTLWALFRPERRALLLGEFTYLLKASPVWVLPVVTANIIDAVARHAADGPRVILVNAVIGASLILLNIPTGLLYARFTSRAIRGLETGLRSALVRRLQVLPISFHGSRGTGALQTKVLRDVESIEQMSRQLIDGGTFAVVSILVAIAVTAARMPVFVPVFFLLVPAVLVIRRSLSARLRGLSTEFRESIEGMSSRVLGMIAMLPVTRAHAAEDEEIARVEDTLGRVRQVGQRLDQHNGLFSAVGWVTFMLVQLAILVAGAWFSYRGTLALGPGDLVLLSGYVAAVVSAVMQLNAMLPVITRGFDAIRSVGDILEETERETISGGEVLAEVSGDFTFEHAGFRYADPDGKGARLEGIDLTVRAGETIGIIGPSGSGKSTLMNLVIGFHQAGEGRVLLDGHDMTALDLRSYRRHLSVVGQQTLLFDGTLGENITYGAGPVGAEQLAVALEAANAAEFVAKLPHGLETRIGEGGARLSGGQRQRIAIARALLRNPRVLILDEATSALDGESERLVQQALDRLMEGRTTFIVAHRLSTLRRADRIVVLEEGRVAAIGTPRELAGKDPQRFRELAA